MIYILFVVFISSAIFVTFKYFKKYKVDNFQAITINYLVASICGLIISPIHNIQTDIIQKPWLVYAITIGFIFVLTFLLFALSSQKAGVAITAVFSKMSVIIPVIFGIFLYGEQLNALKILGIIATFLAFLLVFYKKDKKNIKWAVIIFPILIFFGNGIIDSMLKYIEFHYINGDTNYFLTVIFLIALTFGSIISFIRYLKSGKGFNKSSLIGGFILGILNYSTTYYMILAMSKFESNVLFPIQNVGVVMISTLAGLILFKERLSKLNWLGIGLAIAAILLIAFA